MQAWGSPNSDSAIASTTRVLPEPVGPRNKKISNRPPGRIQPGEEHLIDFGDFFDGRILANDFAPESGFEIQRVVAAPRRIRELRSVRFS